MADHPIFEKLHPIFREVVDPDSGRYDLSTPWIVGDFVYASDGRIIVRAFRPKLDIPDGAFPATKEGARRVRDPHQVYAENEYREAVPVPLVPVSALCDDCGGSGQLKERPCKECRGGGTCYRCDCENPHDCGYCAGKGIVPAEACSCCKGVRNTVAVEMAPGYFLAGGYARLLRKHDALVRVPKEYKPFTGQYAESFNQPGATFTIGDIEGVIMPMRRPAAQEDIIR